MPTTTIKEALIKAMNLEKEGFAFYKNAAEKTQDSEGKEMFLFLAEEETKHSKKILEILNEGNFEGKPEVWVPETSDIDTNIFKEKVSGGETNSKADSLSALNIGIAAEKNSIELYTKIAEQIDNQEYARFFNTLIGEEQKHLTILEKEVEFVTETGNFYDFKTVTT